MKFKKQNKTKKLSKVEVQRKRETNWEEQLVTVEGRPQVTMLLLYVVELRQMWVMAAAACEPWS